MCSGTLLCRGARYSRPCWPWRCCAKSAGGKRSKTCSAGCWPIGELLAPPKRRHLAPTRIVPALIVMVSAGTRLIATTPFATMPLVMTLMSLLVTGCNQDARLAAYAERAIREQARQNEQLAEQSQIVLRQGEQLTTAAQTLVAEDAAARRHLAEAQGALQTQFHASSAALDQQRESLSRERANAARAAHREPLIASTISAAALLLAALAPLVVVAYALARLPQASSSDGWLLDELGRPEFGQLELLPPELWKTLAGPVLNGRLPASDHLALQAPDARGDLPASA